jgi:large subunit ribosomal protein L25
MSKALLLKASTRKQLRRAGARSVRKNGNVPGVLYGKRGSQAIQINQLELSRLMHKTTSENVLVDLELNDDGKVDKRLALVQEVVHDPLEDNIVHIDLHEVAQDEKIHTEVPVRSIGEPVGVRTGGGILETVLRVLKVECLPKDLPDVIEVDITGLELGKSIHVAEITAPPGVTILNPKELTVFAVKAPVAEEVAPVAGEVAQPEVIREKKTEETAEGAPAAAKAKDAAKEAGKEGKATAPKADAKK